jgi:hypothetical protein
VLGRFLGRRYAGSDLLLLRLLKGLKPWEDLRIAATNQRRAQQKSANNGYMRP